MKIWLVIGSDSDGAWVDGDCIFEHKSLAEAKAAKLNDAVQDDDCVIFTVTDIDLPCNQEEAITMVADSIRANADAMMSIADTFKEFLYCTCTYQAQGEGHTVIHPTIVVKKGE